MTVISHASLTGGRAAAPFTVRPEGPHVARGSRVRASGKFFRLDDRSWLLKGMTYGPFAPNRAGQHLPEPPQLDADLAHVRRLGATAIRLYHLPTVELLDAAASHDLR